MDSTWALSSVGLQTYCLHTSFSWMSGKHLQMGKQKEGDWL